MSGAQASTHQSDLGEDRLFDVSTDPVRVHIRANRNTYDAEVAAEFEIPAAGWVKAGNAVGNLKDSVHVDLNFPRLLSGSAYVKMDGQDVEFSFDFKAFGQPNKGKATIVQL